MRSTGIGLLIVCGLAVTRLGAAPAAAQCPVTGGPPIPEVQLAAKVTIQPVTGGFGNGDDRFKVLKGLFTTTGGFNPMTTDGLAVTLYRNTTANQMVSIALPPITNWSSSGPGRYKYNDPTSALGIRRVIVRELSPNLFLLVRILGRNTSLLNAPLSPGDQMEVQIEVDHGGFGDCFDQTLMTCTGTTNQQCH
ncbi:MAG: hypothetical protein SF182_24485 [Deltaproteobacteria bacterium]|nr:hypothetical protein [Deltaproteobacteria bacterium]